MGPGWKRYKSEAVWGPKLLEGGGGRATQVVWSRKTKDEAREEEGPARGLSRRAAGGSSGASRNTKQEEAKRSNDTPIT